jgi:hypothetical protein
MSITAKPTAYTVDTGHAKCPDHLYMLDDLTGATTVADSVGSLDMTADSTSMWNTDGTYGQILRFINASSQKAISAASFAATSGICLVLISKSANAANPGADQYGMGFGSATTGIYGGIQYNLTDGYFVGTVDTGGITNTKTVSTDIYDAGWHILALKTNDSTGSNGVVSLSLDGAAWSSNAGTGDQDLAQYTRLALGCTPQATPNGFFDGDILAAYVYVDDYSTWSDAWIASLFDDPWQFLDTTGSAAITPNPAALSV